MHWLTGYRFATSSTIDHNPKEIRPRKRKCVPGLFSAVRRETSAAISPCVVFVHGSLLDGRVMIPWSRIDETKCWHCPVAHSFSTAKIAGIVILQGYTELPWNNPQFFTARKMARPADGFFRSSLDRRITNSPYSWSSVKSLYATTETMIINI